MTATPDGFPDCRSGNPPKRPAAERQRKSWIHIYIAGRSPPRRPPACLPPAQA